MYQDGKVVARASISLSDVKIFEETVLRSSLSTETQVSIPYPQKRKSLVYPRGIRWKWDYTNSG
jgi:hypothetical protein